MEKKGSWIWIDNFYRNRKDTVKKFDDKATGYIMSRLTADVGQMGYFSLDSWGSCSCRE